MYGKEVPRERKLRIAELRRELMLCYNNPSAYARRGEEYIRSLKAEIAKLDEE